MPEARTSATGPLGRLHPRWKFAATVPIADIYPRQTQFRHIEYPSYVGVSVMEMDFERIDINQCPLGAGNPGPNRYAGTNKCKSESTECEPLHGYGFRRGGYQCRCNPGFRLPNVVRRPYLGEIVERASMNQYMNPDAFRCKPIGFIQKLPVQKENSPEWMRLQYMARTCQAINDFLCPVCAEDRILRMHAVMEAYPNNTEKSSGYWCALATH